MSLTVGSTGGQLRLVDHSKGRKSPKDPGMNNVVGYIGKNIHKSTIHFVVMFIGFNVESFLVDF